MEFTVEFYESSAGRRPVQSFVDELKASDPDDFAVVLAGLAKLRDRPYHREPLTKALGDGLFELRHVDKLNTRVLWFFMKGAASWLCTASAIKASRSPLATWRQRASGCATGRKDMRNEEDEL
jgi:hypothetical protein